MGDKLLKDYTTLKIGGPAKFLKVVTKEEDFIEAIDKANRSKIPFIVIGEGSNLLVSDSGFDGLVIINRVEGICSSENTVKIKSGTILGKLINYLIQKGLSGMERMVGIPGTVGGAVFGNAGAYGQATSDKLIKVKVFDGKKTRWIAKKDCQFAYRDSVFKNNDLTILEVEFEFGKAKPSSLKSEADEILQKRLKKYPSNLRCPGSFFKNILAEDVSPDVLKKIPKEKIVYNKIPAGYLLEAVGARGARRGDIEITSYHGNLFINRGNGKASDFYYLAKKYAKKAKEKFGIDLEPEVQLVGFND